MVVRNVGPSRHLGKFRLHPLIHTLACKDPGTKLGGNLDVQLSPRDLNELDDNMSEFNSLVLL
jgi:hypothetical protein